MVAFTLAEVLITLGIIGIVAAMTLPALIQNKKSKELHTALLKNYSVLQSALQKASYEAGETYTCSNIGPLKLKDILVKQLNVAMDCGMTNDNSCIKYNYDMDENGVMIYNIEEYRTYNNNPLQTKFFDDGQFILNDGTLILLENPDVINGSPFITVDVNGVKKKPNRWGHDLFTFQIACDGKLLPMGAQGTDYTNLSTYCSAGSQDKLNGIACAQKAITEKDYFSRLP